MPGTVFLCQIKILRNSSKALMYDFQRNRQYGFILNGNYHSIVFSFEVYGKIISYLHPSFKAKCKSDAYDNENALTAARQAAIGQNQLSI